MNYWIIHNGVRLGPLSLGELGLIPVLPSTPLWREGFAGWVEARHVPEVRAVLFEQSTPPPAPAPIVTGEMPIADDIPPIPAEDDDIPPIIEDGDDISSACAEEASEPIRDAMVEPVEPVSTVEPEKRTEPVPAPTPSSFLLWNIVTCLLCCPVTGVVGIIYALKTRRAIAAGDFVKGAKTSSVAEWMVILSITIGAATVPLGALMCWLASY